VEGKAISPLSITSTLLFDQWRLKPGEEDFTVMQVIVEGKRNGTKTTYIYDLLDRYDTVTHTTSMARTTGYTCTLVARLIGEGAFAQTGICPPEWVGAAQGCFHSLLQGYQKRNILLRETLSSSGI
ncbi:MAG: saccharopine dehydrogenase C-terminal domain-containing protein, partial [Anaerolineae bacterium]|nr:saccharopine dehydrogenase C-terminal domain-containing protein [Anaerolineae bacterium]